MASFTAFITFLSCLSLNAAVIVINTKAPSANSCLKLNSTVSPKSHVVNNFQLQKCCPIGWHLNLDIEPEHGGVPCVEGSDQEVTIDMVFMIDKEAIIYEALEVTDYSIHVSTIFKRRSVQYVEATDFLVLDQHGNLGEMNAKCSTVQWYKESCVDVDESSGSLVGLGKHTSFNAGVYVLIPCMSLSIICLIIVIFVYILIPALNDLTGKALVGLACCLLAMYLCFILQYADSFDDIKNIRIIEKMEDISYLSCGIWLFLLCGNICVNAWYYLPRNEKMGRQRELSIFFATFGVCVLFFGVLSAVAIFTERFLSQLVLLIVILAILIVCVGICCASWRGFHSLKHKQTLAYYADKQLQSHPEEQAKLPVYNKTEIYKFQTMLASTSYILFYAILCYGIKCIRQSVPEVYELFNALAGLFVFLMFLCWRRSRTLITEFWRNQMAEYNKKLDASTVTELMSMTNETA